MLLLEIVPMRFLLFLVALSAAAVLPSAQRLERLREVLPLNPFRISSSAVVTLGDLDGDGAVDLMGSFLTPTFSTLTVWHRNDGTGHFGDQQLMAGGSLGFLIVAELTGDGLPDVLSSSAPYVQGPPGIFTRNANAFPPSISGVLVPLDFEGDGDLDLYHPRGVASFFLQNDGTGTFEDVTASQPGPIAATRAVAFDVEGDGDEDLVVSNPVRLLRNDGSANVSIENLSLHNIDNLPFRALDLEGDGDTDMVLDNGQWAENDGTGRFTGGAFLTSVFDAEFLDFDSDGRMDIVRPGLGGRGLEALRGVEPADFVPVASATLDRFDGLEIERILTADFDGDGDPDLVIETDRYTMLWGDGAGGWDLAISSPEQLVETYEGLYADDFDGDGVVDGLALELDEDGERFVWMPGTGGGAFDAPRDVSSDDAWVGAGTLDLENDGDVDALLVSETEARAYRFDPAAPWTAAANAFDVIGPTGGPTVADVLVGDLNADGFDDAVVITTRIPGAQAPDYVLLNDGAGVLVDGNAGLGDGFFRGDLGDIDLDGDLDFVALTTGGTNTFLNQGDGSFVLGAQAIAVQTNRASVRLVDLDASGALDLATVIHNPGRRIEIYPGNGDGTFDASPVVSLPRQGSRVVPTWLATPDLNGDGLPELYLADGQSGSYFANRGGFVFNDLSLQQPFFPTAAQGFPLAMADLDADGDDDLWLPGLTQILWGQQRQLSWATWPRYGKDLRMELAGTPNRFWGLYASPATASVPSPLGLFLLDPAQGVALGSGLLDARGKAAVTFAVPAEVSLVSPVLYWQGLVGTPLRFTNLETTTFRAF